MHRSSESIGAIATALAKAQIELSNPEKTLTGTIPVRGGERSFRYASLASGLDLVRKCLGQHEIAVIQTTEVDGGQIILTTLLVHASGEWVSSLWPVCAAAEPSAHIKGTALTYARRYALFTLVGIAGEDDLDAPPERCDTTTSQESLAAPPEQGSDHQPSREAASQRQRKDRAKLSPLSPEASAKLSCELISELRRLTGPDDLADWVQRALPQRDQLSKADAQSLEQAFEVKLNQLSETADTPEHDPELSELYTDERNGRAFSEEATKSVSQEVTVIGKPVRERDPDHLKFVASHGCLICGRSPSDAHHLKFAEARAMGRKVSDKFTVPLCRLHHRELHRRGNERGWWQSQGLDPLPVAANLWTRTHGSAIVQSP